MRAAISVLFVAILGLSVFWLVREAPDTPNTAIATDDPEVRIAARHEAAVEDLARALDDAVKNAREAEKTATELEEAIAETHASATELRRLARDNDAVPASLDAVSVTTAEGQRAARIMRLYASRLDERLAEAEELSDRSVEMAEAIENVEESQAQAKETMADAAVLSAEVETAAVTRSRVAINSPERRLPVPSAPQTDEDRDVHIHVIEQDDNRRDDEKIDRIVIGEPGE